MPSPLALSPAGSSLFKEQATKGMMERFSSQLRGIPVNSKTEMAEAQKKDQEILKAAQQFEGLFIHQLMKVMRNTVPKSGIFDSFAMEQYQSMLDEEVAFEMVKRKGLGMSEIFYRQFKKLAEKVENPVIQKEVGKA